MFRLMTTLALILTLTATWSCGDQATNGTDSSGSSNQESQNAKKKEADKSQPLAKRASSAIDDAINFMKPYHDKKSGMVGFSPVDPTAKDSRHPAIAAMVAVCYMNSPRGYNTKDDGAIVRNILDWLVSLQKPDGSIFEKSVANYSTSAALMALVDSKDENYAAAAEKARDFLVRLQAAEDTGYRPSDKFYGGVGYGGDLRPDLSNAHFAVEAVKKAGLPQDHPFYQRAVKFLERCQNWSETNDQVWKDEDGNEVKPGNDGGAIYTPGESKAGVEVQADGTRVLRSYGSMSYALLKCYILCGVDRNDPRVKAVVGWIQKNFDLDKHAGFQAGEKGNEHYQGLYYNYLSMARCLNTYGDTEFKLADGTTVNWAESLAEKLLSLQNDDGSWVNEKNGRWQEGSELLCSIYAVLALEECLDALEK